MCGGTSQSTQQVTIPPEVLAQYSAVNQNAQQVAQTPFQVYSTDPNSFVAPMNSSQNAGVAGSNAAAGQAQPYYQDATGQLLGAQANAQPYLGLAGGDVSNAQATGTGLAGASLDTLNAANQNAAPLNSSAGDYYTQAYQAAQPYNSFAGSSIAQGLGATQPLNSSAASGYSSALAGAQPYNAAATGLAAASAGAVDPTQLNSQAIGQYLSPYLSTVLGGTAAQLNQDNQKAMSGQTGNAISQGAFGGDRAGLAAATLQGQQQLANAQIYSGILNTGYNNALGAAQQQQGVNLSADQANRAALAAASGQLQSIGQQGYAQGTGTAAQQAALGQQEYSQGLGAGQAIQGLGQQVYGQGTGTGTATQGLGQQVFGQGLATSQQQAAVGQQQFEQSLAAAQEQAALGQQQYGMGASTSAALAGLGTGAQTAAEQGAQGQLAAGQVGQQTQQAGLTALYNQFLQQQSYPFQTAQFLANIAEGTGSLSGSTTTTTQPGSLFSDERLKENIKKIGETFDGQPIYSYRYKGDNKTQIGLIAQEVEKHEPKAVGLAAGFKTVDYGKATDKSAKRGKFADGGMPLLPGMSAADLQALLQTQNVTPYGGGLYGGAASGAPHGGSSYVPAANLPVSHLTVAGGLAPQKSGLETVKNIADAANDISGDIDSKSGQKVLSWLKNGLGGGDNDNSDVSGLYRRGGVVRVKRYADGGTPYSDQIDGQSLDIPNEQPDYKLATPGNLPSQKSGASDAKSAADAALDVAKIAAMFLPLKRGGRAGKDDGGEVNDDTLEGGDGNDLIVGEPRPPGSKKYGDFFYSSPSSASTKDGVDAGRAALNIATNHGSEVSALSQAIADKLAHKGTGATGSWDDAPQVTPDQMAAFAAGKPAVTAPTHRSAPRGTGLAAAGPQNVQTDNPQLDAQLASDTPLPEQTSGLAAGAPATPAKNATGLAATSPTMTPEKSPSVMDRIGDAVGKSPVGDYFSGLGKGDKNNWISLLAGIAGAAAAPTRNPLTALEVGLGSGANAYLGSQKQQAQVGQTQAQTGQIGADTKQKNLGISLDLARREALGLLKKDPSGQIVDPATGIHYSNTQGAAGTPAVGTDAPAPTFKYLGAAAQAALPKSAHQYMMDAPGGLGITPNQDNIATSQKIIGEAYQNASDAQTALTTLNEHAQSLLASKDPVLRQGAMTPIIQPYVEKFNSLVTDVGHPEWAIQGLGDVQIGHKLQLAQAAMQSTTSGQHAYQALSDLSAIAANPGMDPHAAATLLAQVAVNTTKDIDKRNALEEAKQHAPNGNYEAQDIMAAFDHDNPPTVYNAMRNAVASIYENPVYASIQSALGRPGTPEYAKAVATLDAAGQARGIPHFSRVFTGG